MKKTLFAAVMGALTAIAIAGLTFAQTYPPNIPVVSGPASISPNDLFQDVVNGYPSAQSQYVNALLLGNYGATLVGNNPENALIGGDFTTNLFQRSTSTGSITTSQTYVADRWSSWSGASTTLTVSKQTGASDIPPGANASLRVNKASGAGVVQACTMQVIESSNAVRFQGQTAEFTFDAKAGSGFSAASSNLAVYVLTGTVADEGSASAGYSINAGIGSSGWTGANLIGGTTGFLIPISTGWARYGVAVPIPSGALEIAVAVCYTPVGTGTSSDWFEFGKAQFVTNSSLTSFAGSAGAALSTNDSRMKSFARRYAPLEALLQYRYYYLINEFDTAGVVQSPAGYYVDTTHCQIAFPLPAPMLKAPTIVNSAITNATFTVAQVGGTPAAGAALAGSGNSGLILAVGSTPAAPFTVGVASFITAAKTQYAGCALLSTAAGAGSFGFNAEL